MESIPLVFQETIILLCTYTQGSARHLAHSRYSINSCWIKSIATVPYHFVRRRKGQVQKLENHHSWVNNPLTGMHASTSSRVSTEEKVENSLYIKKQALEGQWSNIRLRVMKHLKVQKNMSLFFLLSLSGLTKCFVRSQIPEVDLPGTSSQSKHSGTRREWTGSAEY